MVSLLNNIVDNKNTISKLINLREEGRKSFAQQGLPTPKNEKWKYTRVRHLDTDDFILPFFIFRSR